MNLHTKKTVAILQLLATGVFCCCFLSACRHRVPVLQDNSVVLERCTEPQSAYSYSYDAANRKINFVRNDWIFIRKKDAFEKVITVPHKNNCFACTDFWMQHSMWNGKKQAFYDYLAIPPLCFYPLLDTAILTTCFVGDMFMFPVKYWADADQRSPKIIPSDGKPQEVLNKITFDINTSYTDYATNKKTKKLVRFVVSVYDMGVERKLSTDQYGNIDVAKAVPYPLPGRTVTVVLDNSMTVKNGCMFFETTDFLTAEQKADWKIFSNANSSAEDKIQALERLEKVFVPQQFKTELKYWKERS